MNSTSPQPQYFSQWNQDRWVIEDVYAGKRNGFFLDIGASHGRNNSNTFALEAYFGWNGICIEANPLQFGQLIKWRHCTCLNVCLNEAPGFTKFALGGLIGGIVADDTDNNPRSRSKRLDELNQCGRLVYLYALTLEMILDSFSAPPFIDYLSLDVEGAETRILRGFPFRKYRFGAMTVERPTPELNDLLINQNDYVFIKRNGDDGHYIHSSLASH